MSTRVLLISNCFRIVLKGGKEMPDYVPFLFIGVAIIVGAAIISGGLYALANAIKKQK